jgi:hypothetical protein
MWWAASSRAVLGAVNDAQVRQVVPATGEDPTVMMHWLLVYLYVFVVSLALALLLTPLFKRLSLHWGFVDQPDSERRLHRHAMPLLGGCAVFGAFAVNVLFNYLVMLPLSSRIDLPFIELPDLRLYPGFAG